MDIREQKLRELIEKLRQPMKGDNDFVSGMRVGYDTSADMIEQILNHTQESSNEH